MATLDDLTIGTSWVALSSLITIDPTISYQIQNKTPNNSSIILVKCVDVSDPAPDSDDTNGTELFRFSSGEYTHDNDDLYLRGNFDNSILSINEVTL